MWRCLFSVAAPAAAVTVVTTAAAAAAAVFNGDCFTQYTNLSTNTLDYFLQATDAMVLVTCGSDGGEGLQGTAMTHL
jgi:cytoskeletal protein RodZ